MDMQSVAAGDILSAIGYLVLAVAALILLLKTVRYIPNNRVGIVEKLISGNGSVKAGLIALNGEAGFQPDVLRGGLHFLMPFKYRVHSLPGDHPAGQDRLRVRARRPGDLPARPRRSPPTTRPATSRTCAPSSSRRAAGARSARSCARAPTPSTSPQFVVITDDQRLLPARCEAGARRRLRAHGGDDRRARRASSRRHQGRRRPGRRRHGARRPVAPAGRDHRARRGRRPEATARTYHNNFQDPERFLAAGGLRGRQLQVLVEGTYYVNRLFATVEMIPKTVVEVGTVGVVVSYTGDDRRGPQRVTTTSTASSWQTGRRGVWSEPLLPGKYAFNTYAGKVVMVPTTNFILKWNTRRGGLAPVRREPGRGVPHHQGRLRAVRSRSRWWCTSTTGRRRSSSSASAT